MDRELLASFLAQGHSGEYVPQSGQIVGILKQLQETMEKSLKDATADEEQALADYKVLMAAKAKEIEANQKAIESKTERLGETNVEIVNLEEDLDDTSKALAEDKVFLADLEKNCATKTAEWEARSKTRTQELLALADTIKILSDDDALELFKKTLPSSSLLQTRQGANVVKRQALSALKASHSVHGHRDPRLDLIALALRGHTAGFEKVIKMIDDMVALLAKEQTDDDDKKAYCEASLDKAEDEAKMLAQSIADLEKAIEDTKGMIATLTDEIAALIAGIKELDHQVAEATAQRTEENALYKKTMAEDAAAKDILAIAKNRLAKFYTPKLYQPPPKRELSAMNAVYVAEGGSVPAVAAGGIAGTGVTVFADVSAHGQDVVAPPPPPETWDAYAKKGQEHAGVVEMMNMLATDLDKEMTQMTTDEKDAQAEYEQFVADAAAKRASDSKSLADKEAAKADAEAELQRLTTEHKSTMKAAMDKAEYIKDLHLECDWLLANFQARKAARAGEVESLKNAKAVLSGADYS